MEQSRQSARNVLSLGIARENVRWQIGKNIRSHARHRYKLFLDCVYSKGTEDGTVPDYSLKLYIIISKNCV